MHNPNKQKGKKISGLHKAPTYQSTQLKRHQNMFRDRQKKALKTIPVNLHKSSDNLRNINSDCRDFFNICNRHRIFETQSEEDTQYRANKSWIFIRMKFNIQCEGGDDCLCYDDDFSNARKLRKTPSTATDIYMRWWVVGVESNVIRFINRLFLLHVQG